VRKLIDSAAQLGIKLTTEQLEQFQIYYEELVDWNKRMNLTAITEYDDVQVKHFLDSLTLVAACGELVSKLKPRFLDVGTGAGLPGIPMKIVFPTIELVLLESVAKKTAFLRYLIDRLNLDDVTIAESRAETLAHCVDYREQFDIVTCRAVGTLATTVEISLPFCRKCGIFIAQKKGVIDDELGKASVAIETLGGKLRGIERINLAVFNEERLLVVIGKVGATPSAYPRRPGVPRKRPL